MFKVNYHGKSKLSAEIKKAFRSSVIRALDSPQLTIKANEILQF